MHTKVRRLIWMTYAAYNPISQAIDFLEYKYLKDPISLAGQLYF